jgi:hypothetical protein
VFLRKALVGAVGDDVEGGRAGGEEEQSQSKEREE